jgi:hypothetical protein
LDLNYPFRTFGELCGSFVESRYDRIFMTLLENVLAIQ